MEVSYNQAYILHDKRITNLADMARNLNPLEYHDFESHKNDVIKWVIHCFNDEILASRLKKAESKDDFLKLLMLRYGHEIARNKSEEVPEKEILRDHKVKKILKKEKAAIKKSLEPKNFEEHHDVKKPKIDYEFNDFMHLVFEARQDLEVKEFESGIKKYERLKHLFETTDLSEEHKKRIHAEIKYIFEDLKKHLSN